MTEIEQGWPFLVARGRRRGFRTVLAPEFLIAPRLHGLLADAPATNGHGPGQLQLRPGRVGPVTVVYRTEVISATDLHAPQGSARDEHGRELEIRYGLVFRGRAAAVDGGLPSARDQALASYRRFLEDEEGFDVERSRPVRARVRPAPDPPPARAQRGRGRLPLPLPLRVAVGTAAVVAVGVATVLVVARDRVPHFSVAVAADDVECGDPAGVSLHGRVSAEGPVTLRVHWQAPDGAIGAQRVRFTVKGSQAIGGVYPLIVRPDQRIELVAQAPNGRSQTATLRVRCAVAASASAHAQVRAHARAFVARQ